MTGRRWGLAALALGTVAAAPVPPAAAPAPPTPAAYRAAVEPVGTCAAFGRAFPALPDARPLIRHLFDTPVVQQHAGEGDDAFMDRAVKQLFATLGDPSRLVLRVGLAGQARYDPARRLMILHLPAPFEAELDRWGRREVRIGSAAALVTETSLRARLEFDPHGVGELLLPMAPADAARFPAEARLQTLSVFQDYGTDASHGDARGTAAATQTSYRLVRLRPKCALVTLGDQAVAGWSYDRWDEPAG